MTILKTLYRRETSNFLIDNKVYPVVDGGVVGGGLTFEWEFAHPGWISFDFLAIVPSPASGALPDKYFEVYINGVRRFQVRGAWSWTRQWIYVDEGVNEVTFRKVGYDSSDTASVRRINLTHFLAVPEPIIIEATTMPKSLESIVSYSLLMGWQRYQRSGPKGCELDFTLVFDDMAKWRQFMASLENFYIIKGDYGVYGGTILPQDCDTVRKGGLILMKCKMQSPMTAGVGVDGE